MSTTISDYIKTLGKQVKNQQKLLSYYGELYEFYVDKLPKNKYIYYLEENPYTQPFSTMPPQVNDFFSMGSLNLNMLTPYVRLFKKFKGKKGRKIEIPFENKTDFESFNDPVGYVGGATDFTSERFMGPIAALTGLTLSFKGAGGKGAIPRTTHVGMVDLSMKLQDVKLLFKNWDDKESVKYKDMFAYPGKKSYYIILEMGYAVPDGSEPEVTRLAGSKLVFTMSPNGAKTSINYSLDGSAELKTRLDGWVENVTDDINLLNPKYYKQIRRSKNMLLIEDEDQFSTKSIEKKLDALESLKEQYAQKGLPPSSPGDPQLAPKATTVLEEMQKTINDTRRNVQLAKSVGAVPPVFSFIAALYEAGKVYYIELDNERYKDYMKKIAGNLDLDVSKINVIPKRKQKIKLEPDDFLKKSKDTTDYHAGSLRIRSFNKGAQSSTKFEKVKFFYFGDLVNVILNSRTGGGAGQDLDDLGNDSFRVLLGPTVWVKSANMRKIYNIANTPISLDMFLFELNKEIHSKNRKSLPMGEFFGSFMKRFFDLVVLSAEKQKTGRDQQRYTGKINYIFDKEKIEGAGKFLNSLHSYVPERGTNDTVNMLHLTTILEDKKITKKAKNSRNIPTLYLGGPDRGPLMNINFDVLQLPAEATRQVFAGFNSNKGTSETVGEVKDDSVLISAKTKATITLKGNPYLNLMDYILVDTRFVDGGYFQEDNSSIFFTGYYVIYAITHTMQGNSWVSKYETTFLKDFETPTFQAFTGPLPSPQGIDLMKQAQAETKGAPPTAHFHPNESSDKKPNSTGKAPSVEVPGPPKPHFHEVEENSKKP